jgi:hypothetical protein
VGKPCELVSVFGANSIVDENLDHTDVLQRVLAQLPPEMATLSEQFEWAVAWGYLMKGALAFLWDRPGDGRKNFPEAIRLGAQVDPLVINQFTSLLLDYEAEFGETAAQKVLQLWVANLKALGKQASARQLNGAYSINKAFQGYRVGKYHQVPKRVLRAIVYDPGYSTNRGVQSILLRSILGGKFA